MTKIARELLQYESNINYEQVEDVFRENMRLDSAFFERLSPNPDFSTKTIIDFGAGSGCTCLSLIRKGAKSVIGVEPQAIMRNLATDFFQNKYPAEFERIRFVSDLSEIEDETIDYIVSKNTFEHVFGLNEVLAQMNRCLKSGGRMYSGFGPLWNSPYGDHRLLTNYLPWGHLIFSEGYHIDKLKKYDVHIADISELGLNQMSLADYQNAIHNSDLKIISFEVNKSKKNTSRFFSWLRRFSLLEEYFSHNIYCTLEKG